MTICVVEKFPAMSEDIQPLQDWADMEIKYLLTWHDSSKLPAPTHLVIIMEQGDRGPAIGESFLVSYTHKVVKVKRRD